MQEEEIALIGGKLSVPLFGEVPALSWRAFCFGGFCRCFELG